MENDATNPVDVEDDAILDAPEVDAESYSDDDTQAETEGAKDGQPEDANRRTTPRTLTTRARNTASPRC